MRILIAEDETIIRLDLRDLLERSGYEVCAEARDGREAVDLAHEHQPDLVILDVKMPNLDGIEAARMITAERPIPIVLLTAYAGQELVARAVGAGVFGYIVKPFREVEIAPALELAWARHADWLTTRRDLGRTHRRQPRRCRPGRGHRRGQGALAAPDRAPRRRHRRRDPRRRKVLS